MFPIDHQILIAAVLLFAGVITSKLSPRIGLPVLVIFLGIGMLAGEDGIGRIQFDDVDTAHALGTLALAIILFDGGLQTSLSSIKLVWKPASALATIGVAITAGITGAAAAYILNLSLPVGFLLGAIVGSTDAAAVFTILRNAGIYLSPRLKSTLEIESASNDPMAIFLTIGLLQLVTTNAPPGSELFILFIQQIGIGAIIGLAIGYSAVRLFNSISLQAPGLYPVMVSACGLLSFGASATLGGSGFFSVFITGVIIGNGRFVYQRATFLFHDGLAWLSQIGMFVMLGLLVTPSSLIHVWREGLLIALVLIFIARPLAIGPLLAYFGFNKREIALVSWVGLRGSVPIILAIFPLIFGLPQAPLLFNVVFFVVLISATLQGSTLPLIARKLKLIEPPPATPSATLEIAALANIDTDIVRYTLGENAKSLGLTISQLALPEGAVIAMVVRGNDVFPPRGSTKLEKEDHLFIVLKPGLRKFVDCIFSTIAPCLATDLPDDELLLKGSSTLEDIFRSYGIIIEPTNDISLSDFLKQSITPLTIGSELRIDAGTLTVQSFQAQEIATVSFTRNPLIKPNAT
ncbi:potassium/proton antiporter [Amphritea sp. 1_MG-2023]|uniref:potassium/proton antiporter n=1 Tax=Amphritea sp. 1_MG-2023 TaxID=3062670 RepID=UPI0026E11E2B|nr:potassium/proton antiporter [Amphritea sp. 1_MG-2023]MDO6562823.1 potassium/proton antiporter [Amphritea sp. 1_MG-2023]